MREIRLRISILNRSRTSLAWGVLAWINSSKRSGLSSDVHLARAASTVG
jgi:hypothetical protein